MPELPEVETIKREIEPFIVGRKIEGIEIKDHRNIKGISPEQFKKKLIGQKFKGLTRQAKYMLFELASGNYLTIHLGMTGRLLFAPDKYVKIVFNLSGGKNLYFSDARLFGKIRFFEAMPNLKLGPEPLQKEFTVEYLKKIFSKRHSSIKVLLLDQKLLSGVGNIYANEALFRAGINPHRKASSLSEAEIKKMQHAIEEVLEEAIKYRGTSDSWYVDAKGEKGGFQLRLKVYGKKNQPCPKCGTTIKREAMGQRGTFFCGNCQK
ncbi:MAG: DNA-formamidopyrimidine glycosylase [Candidatus Margulisbacteria bacterium]|nr:DNA-formamidopyrimidine glycosylase [Candidatus Margulisiibacteriota bacterium]